MDLVMIEAVGKPRERGRAHGEQARELIAAGLDRWRADLSKHGKDADQLWKGLSRESGFRDAAARWTPDLLEEIEGIAAGANADPDAVFAINCLDEAWWWGEKAGGCSAVAVADRGGRPVIGQNMDLDTWMDTTQVVLRLQPDDGPEQILLSRAGMVGLCGANEAGVGVVVNTLDTLPQASDGLPVALVIRMLSHQTSLDGVEALLRSVRHASGQAYTLATSDGDVAGFEAGGDHVASYRNDPDRPNALWHTNHPLASGSALDSAGDGSAGDDWASESTVPRLERVASAMDKLTTVDDLKALLSDADSGVCMFPGRWRADGFTFGSIVISLDTPPEIEVAPGPPDRTPYVAVPFS
ncbi:MAG: C45 family autoproteolytic acyltransferase/hydrolase [Actinomycetes bacterium]